MRSRRSPSRDCAADVERGAIKVSMVAAPARRRISSLFTQRRASAESRRTSPAPGQLDARLAQAALDENALRRGILEVGRRESPVASHQILGTYRSDVPVVGGQPVDNLGALLLV